MDILFFRNQAVCVECNERRAGNVLVECLGITKDQEMFVLVMLEKIEDALMFEKSGEIMQIGFLVLD